MDLEFAFVPFRMPKIKKIKLPKSYVAYILKRGIALSELSGR